MLGETKCRIKGCGCSAVSDARDKHGPGFQGLCSKCIDSQKEREAKTGSHQRSIRQIMGNESLAQRLVNAILNEEGVTTHLTNLTFAEKIAKKLWGNMVSHVDIQRTTDAFHEFKVILDDGQVHHLRQYKQGRWFYFNPKEKSWAYATEY